MEWEYKSLSDICSNLDSQRVPITKNKRVSGSVPYYGASGVVDYVDGYIFNEELLLVSEDGANLLARTYPIAFSVSGKTWVNNHAHVLRFSSSTTRRFVEYYLNSIPLSDFISGMAQPKLNQRALNSIPIPTPDLQEQKRIVAILDQVFADIEKARATAETNLKNARELFDSYLQQVFSERGEDWEDSTLSVIAENLDSKRIPITKKDRVEGEYPYYGASGIVDYVDDYLFDEELLLVSEDGANLLTRTYPIAFSAVGRYWVNNHAHVLRFKNRITQKFIEYYLNSISLAPYVSGMAQPKLNQKALNSITVPKVNEVTASEGVSKLELLEKEITQVEIIYKSKMALLDELKKSILQKAFTGELTMSKGVAA